MNVHHRPSHSNLSSAHQLCALSDARNMPTPRLTDVPVPLPLGAQGRVSLAQLSGVKPADADTPIERRLQRNKPRLRFTPGHALAAVLLLVAVTCASLTLLVQQSANYAAVSQSQAIDEAASASVTHADTPTGETQSETSEQNQAQEEQSQPAPADNRINLNTATSEQLQTINGIGPSIAGKILEYRKQIGQFTSVDQLLDVSGIGSKTLEKIRPEVTV